MSSTGPADDQLKERITQLEYKLEALEKTLPAAIVEKMDGHASAKQADARGQYSIGECQQVVIEEVTDDAGGSQGVSHLQGIAVFVDPRDLSVAVGDTVEIKLTDVKPNVLHGLALNRVDTADVALQS